MQLKDYQEIAIDDLLAKAKKLLGYSGNKKLVFKAPTGSGKTIMMAELLKKLSEDREIKQELSFIWTAPRHLHTQSKNKLEIYLETSQALFCSFFEDLDDRKIQVNEILFFNWESINKKNKNTIVRENEQDFYLSKVLERTKEEGRKIILIIDESHFAAGAKDNKGKQAANKLREEINADLTIEMSATPLLTGDETVNVHLEDVKKEGMIKKAVILNEDFTNIINKNKITTQKLSGGTEEMVIDAAMKKSQELLKAFQKEKVNNNPLILIQLPDRKSSIEDRIRERVEKILKSKYKITTEKGNNKLAIWLSGEHVNKEAVERPDSQVEVLIFKQAIALGWDCPRAQILVLFREWHSQVFSIQTVGRIMRMPDPDFGHYQDEVLNYGYVYTNLSNIEIHEDIAKDYIVIQTSKRRVNYKQINLLSYYSKRHREKTRLTPLFIRIFLKQAKSYNLSKKINLQAKKINQKIIGDYKAEDIDILAGTKIVGDKKIEIGGLELQKIFDYFVRDNLTPLYPEDRSIDKVKESIYNFFETELNKAYKNHWEEIVKITLDEANIQHFVIVIKKSIEIYLEEVTKKQSELIKVSGWNIPPSLSFNQNYKQENYSLSIMQPFYSDDRWKSEKAFIKLLNQSKKINWWFKNGDQDKIFFAVPYTNGELKLFYIDFIVQFKNGTIGFFDPHGTYLADFKTKSDGLQNYIKEQTKNGKKLFGGIVANTQKDYKGRWLYFDQESKKYKQNSLDGWKDLIL